MAKGDDAVRRKKNKVNRKRLRNSESSVSARVAAIIASKRRRKNGKRRICEGMCFSLPTPDDPFNDRLSHATANTKNNHPKKPKPNPKPNQERDENPKADIFEDGCISKFLTLCLNAIHDSWKEEGEEEDEDDDGSIAAERRRRYVEASAWGAEFWSRCSSGSNMLDSSRGDCANEEQLSWLLSTASDMITRKERRGEVVASPFLLILVPSKEKALQVRSICRPLKALGIHSVSLHSGASTDHQIQGLKSCEPEFLISTPDRLLELVQLQAIDITGISLLVVDGLKSLVDADFSDKVTSIKENISAGPQMVVFGDCSEEISNSMLPSLLKGKVCKLSFDESVAGRSAFTS